MTLSSGEEGGRTNSQNIGTKGQRFKDISTTLHSAVHDDLPTQTFLDCLGDLGKQVPQPQVGNIDGLVQTCLDRGVEERIEGDMLDQFMHAKFVRIGVRGGRGSTLQINSASQLLVYRI